jgi:nitroreductase
MTRCFMNKYADTNLAIHPLIKKRWSPRSFSSAPIEKEKLERIIESARWSASCYNEQPWRFIIGLKQDDSVYDKIFACLAEGNQVWAKNAPCLVLILMKKTFTHNNKQNKWAKYDCGQAAAYMSLQALEDNLYVHQMAGFDQEKVKELFQISDELEPITAMVIGYQGAANILPDNLKKMEMAPRKRLRLEEIILQS